MVFCLLPICPGARRLTSESSAQVLCSQSTEGPELLSHWSGWSHALLQPSPGFRRVSVCPALLRSAQQLTFQDIHSLLLRILKTFFSI